MPPGGLQAALLMSEPASTSLQQTLLALPQQAQDVRNPKLLLQARRFAYLEKNKSITIKNKSNILASMLYSGASLWCSWAALLALQRTKRRAADQDTVSSRLSVNLSFIKFNGFMKIHPRTKKKPSHVAWESEQHHNINATKG